MDAGLGEAVLAVHPETGPTAVRTIVGTLHDAFR